MGGLIHENQLVVNWQRVNQLQICSILSTCWLAAQKKKKTGTIRGDAWVKGNVLRGDGKDGDAARNVSRWRLEKAQRYQE